MSLVSIIKNPRTDPHHVFQSFKLHPLAWCILEGGKMVRYGAKTLPYGGWLDHAAAGSAMAGCCSVTARVF